MASRKGGVRAAQAALHAEVADHFRELASGRGLTLDDGTPSVLVHEGLLVAVLAAGTARAGKGGATTVGMLHITAPAERKVALVAAEHAAVPPGDYLIEISKDSSSIGLRGVGADVIIPVAAGIVALQDTSSDPYYCGTTRHLEVHIDVNGRICVFVVCEGLWIVLLFCLTNPFRWLGSIIGTIFE